MTLDAQIGGMIEVLDSGFPPVHTMTGAEARAAIHGRFVAASRPEPVASVQDFQVPTDNGRIDVRVYRPETGGPLPIVVFAHGGGWVFCDLESHDGLCRSFANLTPAVVISVDYRLAPEHRWPTAAEDLYAATCWAAEHAAEFGADPSQMTVGGDSAGGNLAAVVALMARDRGGPALAAQLLLYPLIAADFDTTSYRLFGRGFYNPRHALQWYWDQYVPVVSDRRHPYASPLQADLSGLPPAVVVLAGHDPLRDEGIAYADGLEAAGVPTVRCTFEGGIHGFMTMPKFDIAQRARRQASQALGELLCS
ncbi:alpha/beta hydrolase [Mycobacterium sp. BMJ-28]